MPVYGHTDALEFQIQPAGSYYPVVVRSRYYAQIEAEQAREVLVYVGPCGVLLDPDDRPGDDGQFARWIADRRTHTTTTTEEIP